LSREELHCDVAIVGAGPAGLAAAIRLKQANTDLSVVVLEKAAAVGDHILSGAVVDPVGIEALLPNFRDETDHPFTTPVGEERFLWLTRRMAVPLPTALLPPLMGNRGNFAVSLGKVVRWLGDKAAALGVEIYPGFAAADLVLDAHGAVRGVRVADRGRTKDGEPGPGFLPGPALLARYTLIAEGARGSLSNKLIRMFRLDAGRAPQKFGLGVKELWRIDSVRHRPGRIQHSFGWPLDNATGGGSFLYHLEDNQVALGLVVHLDYANPYLSPFEELQRIKTHFAIRPILEGGERLSYGARVISEGGWQSAPRTAFPGGLLLGCVAGLVNVPQIKGSHNAVLSGILAAECVARAIAAGRAHDELDEFDQAWRAGPIGADLRRVRNVKPLFSRFGTLAGAALGGVDMWAGALFDRSPFGALSHRESDHAALRPAASVKPIRYLKPDNRITFDRPSSVFLSNTHHPEDQPPHLVVSDPDLQRQSEFGVFAGPSTRYCPAGVYEWVEDSTPRLIINAANCIHCKTCDVKDPNQNIEWTPPESGGPSYSTM
jgi:electron-transferring-flavoprotein dehydrogenase